MIEQLVLLPRLLHVAADAVPADGVLGAISFGPHRDVPVPLLAGEASEVWLSASPVRTVESGAVRVSFDGENGFATVSAAGGYPLEEVTKRLYVSLVGALRAAGYGELLRVWHHVGSINENAAGLERYRRFCLGRYEALRELGYRCEGDLPAASAVGMPGDGLVIWALASRSAGTPVENPRQLSAYHYPESYGPRSPSFARALRKDDGSNAVLFVSGTASIVGHETRHVGDAAAQLGETLENLRAVLGAGGFPRDLRRFTSMKLFVRHAEEAEPIATALRGELGPSCSLMVVQADICRRELLLEIEGVAAMRN